MASNTRKADREHVRTGEHEVLVATHLEVQLFALMSPTFRPHTAQVSAAAKEQQPAGCSSACLEFSFKGVSSGNGLTFACSSHNGALPDTASVQMLPCSRQHVPCKRMCTSCILPTLPTCLTAGPPCRVHVVGPGPHLAVHALHCLVREDAESLTLQWNVMSAMRWDNMHALASCNRHCRQSL